MKLSLDWIKEYVELPKDLEPSRIAYDLTMSTAEVEGLTKLSEKFDNLIIGVIKEVFPHPNADKLRVCKTDLGGLGIREIVCGGSNLRNGMKVAVACPGAMVRWHGEGDLVEIKNVKLRGVESYGMICASSEIGLSDLFPAIEEAEITDLSNFSAPTGTNLAKALGLDDIILEIDNKSLTNRPDLWGHYGIARELSVLYKAPLKEIKPFVPNAGELEVVIEDPSLCPRYIGVKIEGVGVKPSPFEMQSRLWRVGMRPINALVDITNYVMLAVGQPTHAFDADNISGNITVRTARHEEKLLLLNGKEVSLLADDLVIADKKGAVGLAGIMGGSNDSISKGTNRIILEIANFTPLGIRRTAVKYEARTEAAIRNEKGIDPERCDLALSLAMELFKNIYPNMRVDGFCDNYPKRPKSKDIKLSFHWLCKRIGGKFSQSEVSETLKRLGFKVEFNKDIMHINVPSWRATGDVSIPADIIEEVARMYGFDNFKPSPIAIELNGAINQLDIDIDRKMREYLAFRCGMREVFTYPWVSDEYLSFFSLNSDEMLALATPPSPNERYIRSSLLPNLCKAVVENLRYFNEFAIFESADVFFDRNYTTKYDSNEALPCQKRSIAGAHVSTEENVILLFRKVKGVIESMPIYVHTEPITFEKKERPFWADNMMWLNIMQDGKRIGDLALLSKKSSINCGIKKSSVMMFELDIDSLKPLPSRDNKFIKLTDYPVTERDLSLVVGLPVKWSEILNEVKRDDFEDLLKDIIYVGEYLGGQIPGGKKSVTFRLVIGSVKKTLTSAEIEYFIGKIVNRLRKVLGAELRG